MLVLQKARKTWVSSLWGEKVGESFCDTLLNIQKAFYKD